MRRNSKLLIIISITLSVMFLSGTVFAISRKKSQPNQTGSTPPQLKTIIRSPSPTRPVDCVPLPHANPSIGSPTPTPTPFPMGVFMSKSSTESAPIQVVTPRTYAHQIDLSPEVSLRDKWEIIVFRCDGTIDQYLAGPEIQKFSHYLNLNPGDVIINTIPPASLMGHRPPEPSDWSITTPATSMPYPISGPRPMETPTTYPYPIYETPST